MKEIERKPWVRWLDLTCAVIWLINLIRKLSNYFQQLDRGAPPERLTDARLDCMIAGFIAVAGFLFRLADGPEKACRLAGQTDLHGGGPRGVGGHLSSGLGQRLSAVFLVDHPGGIGRHHPLRCLEMFCFETKDDI